MRRTRAIMPQYLGKGWTSWMNFSTCNFIVICSKLQVLYSFIWDETGRELYIHLSMRFKVRCSTILSDWFTTAILCKSLPFHISVSPSVHKDCSICPYHNDIAYINLYVYFDRYYSYYLCLRINLVFYHERQPPFLSNTQGNFKFPVSLYHFDNFSGFLKELKYL